MLYLTLNQSCQNLINQQFPDDIMKIIYQYVIALNNKEKINDLFNICDIKYKMMENLSKKTCKELQKLYKDTWSIHNVYPTKFRNIKNSGKNNRPIKQDYVDKLAYNQYLVHMRKAEDKLENDLIFAKNIETNKFVTNREYQKLRNKYQKEFYDDVMDYVIEFNKTNEKYKNIHLIATPRMFSEERDKYIDEQMSKWKRVKVGLIFVGTFTASSCEYVNKGYQTNNYLHIEPKLY